MKRDGGDETGWLRGEKKREKGVIEGGRMIKAGHKQETQDLQSEEPTLKTASCCSQGSISIYSALQDKPSFI